MRKLVLLTLLLIPLIGRSQEDLWADDDWDEADTASNWSGFVEGGFGSRLSSDPLLSTNSTLADLRWRIETRREPGKATLSLKSDLGYDAVEDDWLLDVRDLNIAFPLGDKVDIKIGRQVQTWGTGDLVFLNDLFPKDFVSFFAGREDEYLKAPGNAVRVSRYSDAMNIDLVWTPVFTPDIYLTGERFSFFSPLAADNVAPQPPLSAIEPDKSVANGEFALRLFRTVAGREYAFYGYHGFFKQPNAMTPSLQATFAALNSVGASLRQPLGPGLVSTEVAYYDSVDDRSGSNPLLPNSQLRLLAAYEWEAKPRVTVGLQYYLEWTLDHDALLANSPNPQFEPERLRHLLTNRLTWRTERERFTWSLFTFFSPSDHDFYLRPVVTWRHSDAWSLSSGANLCGGREQHTFFNQLQDASNVYLRLRYNY